MAAETVHWREDGTPTSPRFGDIYRSAGGDGRGGLAQARQVFLAGCGLLADGDAPSAWAGRPVWQVLENGFGLGLNFLATWQAWLADPQRPARLFYSAVEAFPPEAADIVRSAAPFPELAALAAELAAQWRGLLPGVHRLQLAGGALQLTLAVGDAQPMLAELSGRFDSVFLDGFDPQKNPAMWSEDVLRAVARLARPGARLATWCVAGEVRERLAACGFSVERVAGVPPKRHALRARFEPRYTPRRRLQPGEVAPLAGAAGHCAIVGAGLAGASLAYSLAARGWRVTVLGRGAGPADGASHLPAGVVAPHVSPDDRPLSRLTRAGAAATLARARALLREGTDFAETGVLERHGPGERRRPAGWQAADDATDSGAARALSTKASAAKRSQAGAPADDAHPALWHARAGWLRPAQLVRAMLAAPGVRFVGQAQVARVVRFGNGWRVLDSTGAVLAEADLVALATGFDTLALLQASGAGAGGDRGADTAAWPLHALRGQVAFGPMPDDVATGTLPPFPVNGHGSLIAPVPGDGGPLWITGSTFERANTQPELHAADHAANRQRLAELLPEAGALLAPQWDDGRVQAWAGVRCTVPDRMPMVGPLAWPPETGAPQDLVSKAPQDQEGRAQAAIDSEANQATEPALAAPWVLTGLGSRGLTVAVLCGEIAAAWLHDEPLPVERSLARALRAARWGAAGARPEKRVHPTKHNLPPP